MSLPYTTSIGSTDADAAIGVQISDQCLFFDRAVLIFENITVTLSISANIAYCDLHGTYRIFLREDDEPGTITTISIAGGLYIRDRHNVIAADFKFTGYFRYSSYKQAFMFQNSVAVNISLPEVGYIHFLKECVAL